MQPGRQRKPGREHDQGSPRRKWPAENTIKSDTGPGRFLFVVGNQARERPERQAGGDKIRFSGTTKAAGKPGNRQKCQNTA